MTQTARTSFGDALKAAHWSHSHVGHLYHSLTYDFDEQASGGREPPEVWEASGLVTRRRLGGLTPTARLVRAFAKPQTPATHVACPD